MRIHIVHSDACVRPADNLAWVLRSAFDTKLTSARAFDNLVDEIPYTDRVIVVGRTPLSEAMVDFVPPALRALGVFWGFADGRAVIVDEDLPNPDAAIEQLKPRVFKLEDEARAALAGLPAKVDPKAYEGHHFAGMFLDPNLEAPSRTTASSGWRIHPTTRTLWALQIRFGIGSFLYYGFNDFIVAE